MEYFFFRSRPWNSEHCLPWIDLPVRVFYPEPAIVERRPNRRKQVFQWFDWTKRYLLNKTVKLFRRRKTRTTFYFCAHRLLNCLTLAAWRLILWTASGCADLFMLALGLLVGVRSGFDRVGRVSGSGRHYVSNIAIVSRRWSRMLAFGFTFFGWMKRIDIRLQIEINIPASHVVTRRRTRCGQIRNAPTDVHCDNQRVVFDCFFIPLSWK